MDTLGNYLLSRGLDLTSVKNDGGLDPKYLEGASTLWNTHKATLTAIIQARIDAIKVLLVEKAMPVEVTVYRQSIVELGALIDDIVKYDAEYKRQNPQKPSNAPPVIEAGKEGSL